MHEDEGRLLWRLRQSCLQPDQTSLTQFALIPSRHKRVERDKTQRIIVDHIMQEPSGLLQVRPIGEGALQVLAIIMIARNHIAGHGQRRQRLCDYGILLGCAVVNQVARCQYHIRDRP